MWNGWKTFLIPPSSQSQLQPSGSDAGARWHVDAIVRWLLLSPGGHSEDQWYLATGKQKTKSSCFM